MGAMCPALPGGPVRGSAGLRARLGLNAAAWLIKVALVSFDDWMLSLHVLSAFAYAAGIVLFWMLVVAVRKTDTPEGTIRMAPMVQVGNASVGIGAGGTILLGTWLAFRLDSYAIWDGWIIAAFVLWAISAAVGARTGAEYMKGMTKARELQAAGQNGSSAELLAINRTARGVMLHSAASVLLVLILVDMVFKPGA
jgi:hypothetical protein